MPPPPSFIPRVFRFGSLNVLLPLAFAWFVVMLISGDLFRLAPDPYAGIEGAYGALNLELKLPGTCAGIEEPLMTVGSPGNATFVFIRLLPHGTARVGIEFWGAFAKESEIITLPSQRDVITLKVSIPAIFPKAGAPEWRLTPETRQQHLLSHFSLAVDSVVRLQGAAPATTTATAPVYIGANPIGGSMVSNSFTGRVQRQWRDN